MSYPVSGPATIGTTSTITQLNGNVVLADTTTTAGDMIYADISNNMVRLAPGTAGQFLQTNGAGSSPTWATNVGALQYDAIVSTSGAAGTYPLLSTAISAGKTKIFIQSGTYNETSQVVLPTGVKITGQQASNTIITATGLSSPLLFYDGSGGIAQSAGTISISNGTSSVTGSGTTFTALSPGNFILIAGIFYTIGNVTSNTALTITELYRGRSLVGSPYVAYGMTQGPRIEEVSLVNISSSSSGLSIKGVSRCLLRNMTVQGFNNNILISQATSVQLELTLARSGLGSGITFTDVYNSAIKTVGCANNAVNGLLMNGSTFNIICSQLISNNNGSHGVLVSSATNVVNIIDSIVENNAADGINTSSTTSNINVVSCSVYKNAVGINCGGTANAYTCNVVTYNTSHGIVCGGNDLVSANTVAFNGGNGISASNSSNNAITANTIHDNTGDGVAVSALTQRCTITGNTIYDQGGNGITISTGNNGDNTVTGNVCYSNVGIGISVSSSSCILSSNRCTGNNIGISINAQADSTIVSSNNARTNTTSTLVNNGTNTSLTGNLT